MVNKNGSKLKGIYVPISVANCFLSTIDEYNLEELPEDKTELKYIKCIIIAVFCGRNMIAYHEYGAVTSFCTITLRSPFCGGSIICTGGGGCLRGNWRHIFFSKAFYLFNCYIACNNYNAIVRRIICFKILLKITSLPVLNITFITNNRPMVWMFI